MSRPPRRPSLPLPSSSSTHRHHHSSNSTPPSLLDSLPPSSASTSSSDYSEPCSMHIPTSPSLLSSSEAGSDYYLHLSSLSSSSSASSTLRSSRSSLSSSSSVSSMASSVGSLPTPYELAEGDLLPGVAVVLRALFAQVLEGDALPSMSDVFDFMDDTREQGEFCDQFFIVAMGYLLRYTQRTGHVLACSVDEEQRAVDEAVAMWKAKIRRRLDGDSSSSASEGDERRIRRKYLGQVGDWRAAILVALLVAQKVFDDESVLNVEFPKLYSSLRVSRFNALELRLVKGLQWQLWTKLEPYNTYVLQLYRIMQHPELFLEGQDAKTASHTIMHSYMLEAIQQDNDTNTAHAARPQDAAAPS